MFGNYSYVPTVGAVKLLGSSMDIPEVVLCNEFSRSTHLDQKLQATVALIKHSRSYYLKKGTFILDDTLHLALSAIFLALSAAPVFFIDAAGT